MLHKKINILCFEISNCSWWSKTCILFMELQWRCIPLHIERETNKWWHSYISACVCARLTWGVGTIDCELGDFHLPDWNPDGLHKFDSIAWHCMTVQHYNNIHACANTNINTNIPYLTWPYKIIPQHTIPQQNTLHEMSLHSISTIHYIHTCKMLSLHEQCFILTWIPILCALLCFWYE